MYAAIWKVAALRGLRRAGNIHAPNRRNGSGRPKGRTLLHVRHDADDFRVGREMSADGIAAMKVAPGERFIHHPPRAARPHCRDPQ